jgi:hypothetical protein
MNKAKSTAKINGRTFLRDAFEAEQKVLAVQLELSAKSITHDGVMGGVNESHFIQSLRRYLPKRYDVDHGIVIDSSGATSDQIDIVIFDHQYSPTLLDQNGHRFMPAEAVYCVLEVKPTISKRYLKYAADKAQSVRTLRRTSVGFTHSGGKSVPKPLFPIMAGIVAAGVEWRDGLSSREFPKALSALKDSRHLDCGLALSDRSFDQYGASLYLSPARGSLAVFLFRLLGQLQQLGTAPAIDWNRYASVFGH